MVDLMSTTTNTHTPAEILADAERLGRSPEAKAALRSIRSAFEDPYGAAEHLEGWWETNNMELVYAFKALQNADALRFLSFLRGYCNPHHGLNRY